MRSHPVSRVLCLCGHLSGTRITTRLKRRSQARHAFAIPGEDENTQAAPSCLASDGVYPASASPQARCALTLSPEGPHHFALTAKLSRKSRRRYVSVALSGGSPRPAVSRHRCPVKPGLSSASRPAVRAAATRMTSALSIAHLHGRMRGVDRRDFFDAAGKNSGN